MKTLFAALALVLALPASPSETIVGRDTSGGLVGPVEVIRPAGSSDTYAFRTARKFKLLYSLASLGPTTAIDSGNLTLDGIEEYMVVVFNGNTTNTRALVFVFKDPTPTTMFSITPTACAANTTCTYSFGRGATATGLTAGYAVTPPAVFQLTATAPGAGTGNGSIWIYGR